MRAVRNEDEACAVSWSSAKQELIKKARRGQRAFFILMLELLAKSKVYQVVESELAIFGQGGFPVWVMAQIRVIVAKHKSKEDFSNNPASHGAKLWRTNLLLLGNRNIQVCAGIESFCQDISPQWTLTLKGPQFLKRCNAAPHIAIPRLVDCLAYHYLVVC